MFWDDKAPTHDDLLESKYGSLVRHKHLEINMLNLFEEESKRLAHVMGMNGEALVNFGEHNDIEIMFDVEGYSPKKAREILQEKLEAYQDGDPQIWGMIKESFYDAYLQRSEKIRDIVQHNYYRVNPKKGDETFSNQTLTQTVSAGWQKHLINIVFYKDFVILSNRGEKARKRPVSVHLRKRPLRYNDLNVLENAHTFSSKPVINNLKEMVDFRPSHGVAFKNKHQKYGTCTYANLCSSIEPMIALVKLELEGRLTLEELRKHANEDRAEYKQFTTFCRDHEIDRLIGLLTSTKGESLKAYVNVSALLLGNSVKKWEIKRASSDSTLCLNKESQEFSRLEKLYLVLSQIEDCEQLLSVENLKKLGDYAAYRIESIEKSIEMLPLYDDETQSDSIKMQPSRTMTHSYNRTPQLPPLWQSLHSQASLNNSIKCQ